HHFVSNAPSAGLTHIPAFVSGPDRLDFAHAAFGNFASGNASPDASHFTSNATGAPLANTNPQFIFNTTDHTLYYDPDGSGAGAAVAMAKIENAATVAANDIHLV